MKPDGLAFEKLLGENLLSANECLFVDDQKNNIETAKKLVIKALLFTSAENAKTQIIKSTAD